MINRLCTALVALLVVVGFALPASAAPIDAPSKAGLTLHISNLIDTIVDALAVALSVSFSETAKADSGGSPVDPAPRDSGFERMMMGLEPNG